MLESAVEQAVSMARENASSIACAATMATMLLAYVLCGISARRRGSDFSLGRLERVELDRAVLLYERVLDRLHDIRRETEEPRATLLARYRRRRQARSKFASELRDLQAYAGHMRATIVSLRRKPLGRVKSWRHLDSSRFALGRSIVACLLILAVLAVCSRCFEQLAVLDQKADDIGNMLAAFLPWQDAGERMIDTNLIGACFLPIAAPLFYFYRRLQLRMEHGRHFRKLKRFALADPDRLIRRQAHPPDACSSAGATVAAEPPVEAPPTMPSDTADENPCFSVLGVSRSATAEEIRQAYKAQVRQNHPDRVHDMSPAFRELAEAETKKLNAAYQEALMSLQQA